MHPLNSLSGRCKSGYIMARLFTPPQLIPILIARTEIFGTIVVASRNLEKAKKRTNNAVLGAGIEGFFPRIIAEKLDIHSNDFSTRLREIKPDFIFSAPSLLPWWKLAPDGINIPFAGYTALHLSLMQKFRNRIAESSVKSIWIGAYNCEKIKDFGY